MVDPELTGPREYWYPCVPGTGWGSNNCVYTGASGGDSQATNCGVWVLPGRAGHQQVMAFVPHKRATATVTYRIEWTNVYTGTRYRYRKSLNQQSVSGWTGLGTLAMDARNVTITVCDNEARQHFRDDPERGLIGIDAVAARCVAECIAPESAAPRNVRVSPQDEHRTRIAWTHGSEARFPRIGYRVQYSRPAVVGHVLHGDLEAWRSIVYEVVSPLHHSPPLRSGVTYQVDVWAVDEFGRDSRVVTKRFVHFGPNCQLGPHDSTEVVDPDSLTQALESIRDGLDISGTAEPTPFSDMGSGLISAYLGDWDEVWISAVSMVPYIGDGAKAAKVPKRAAKIFNRAQALRAEIIMKRFTPVSRLDGFKKVKTVRRMDAMGTYFRRALDTFHVGGYRYVTDDFGRVSSVSGPLKTGVLDEGNKARSKMSKFIKQLGNGKTDDMGHLIPRTLRGPSTQPYNLVPQAKSVNRRIQKELEQQWHKHLGNGDNVFVEYTVNYGRRNNTLRPDSFEIRWWLNGHEQPPRFFSNT